MKGRLKARPEGAEGFLPRVGSLKVGRKSEKGYPQSVDWFIPTGKYAPLFTKAYGEKPQTVQIVFMSDDPEQVCREEYEYRDDEGKRIAWGDGETFMVWNGEKYVEVSAEKYPNVMEAVQQRHPTRRTRNGDDGWTVTLTLLFALPMVRGIAGLWQFVTKGTASSIPNIRDAFDAMQQMRGEVKGIVWDMTVQFAVSQAPGSKSRFPVVSIVPNESEENITKIREAMKPVKLIE